jgi:uncharacterized protein (DUF433 family)
MAIAAGKTDTLFMNGRYSLSLPIDLKRDAEEAAQRQGVSLNQLILWSLAEKVTALKSKIDDPNFPDITYKLDLDNQLVPIIKGKGIRVQTLVIAFYDWKESAAKISQQYDLPQKSVKQALSFYEAHKKAVDALIESNSEGEPASV